jgi:hypothetical protein
MWLGNIGTEENEFTLSNLQGTCWICGEQGHRADKCPNKTQVGKDTRRRGSGPTQNYPKKIKGVCNYCEKPGHKAENCWKRPENSAKAPEWYKKKGNKTVHAQVSPEEQLAAPAIDEQEYICASIERELLNEDEKISEFAGMTVPQLFATNMELLKDPNIWIADSGATIDTTPYRTGMVNLIKAAPGSAITMINNKMEDATEVGTIHCTKYNNQGQEANS